jgi:hypothetical protein
MKATWVSKGVPTGTKNEGKWETAFAELDGIVKAVLSEKKAANNMEIAVYAICEDSEALGKKTGISCTAKDAVEGDDHIDFEMMLLDWSSLEKITWKLKLEE